MDKILSISGAAQYLGVLPLTLRNWEKRGKIHAFRTLGGHRRFRQSELDKIVNAVHTGDKLKEFVQHLEKACPGNRAGDQVLVDTLIKALKQMSKAQK